MKLLTFVDPESPSAPPRISALAGDELAVIDLRAAAEICDGKAAAYFSDMLSFLERGDAAREHAVRLIAFAISERDPVALRSLTSLKLLAPLPRPASIRDCMTFERHLIQATRTAAKWRWRPLAGIDSLMEKICGRGILRVPRVWYERPLYYKGNPRSVVGPDADVIWPAYTERLDFELEFGIFIGRQGRNISEQEAARYIGGYTIFNDFSARDVQLREMQGRLGPAKGKDFDTGNSIGPYLVTPDEVPDPYRLTMVARVNGEEWSRSTSAEMHFTFEQIIAYISQDETLYPGDFIGAGTAPGGCGLELDRWLAPGDVVELEVQQLGVLRNRVVRARLGEPSYS